MNLVLAPRAARELEALPEPARRRLLAALRDLQRAPPSGKPLKGPLEGRRSLRVGEYRIIYRIAAAREAARRIEVLKVGHRAGIYRAT